MLDNLPLRRNSSEEGDSGPKPHADIQSNVDFFNKAMERVRWLAGSPVKWEIQDTVTDVVYNPISRKKESVFGIKEYKCAVFVFNKCNESSTFLLNFHQPTNQSGKFSGFKNELCGILNYFGAKGFLEHTLKNHNGTYRNAKDARLVPGANDPDDKWGQIFGKQT